MSNPPGTLSSEILRDELRKAMEDGDRENLEGVIKECVAAGMPELDSSIQRARRLRDNLEELPRRGGQ